MSNLIEYRCGLIDFQVGRDHGKLNFDSAKYIEQCASSGMKRVMFTCKDAYGDAYYKSDLVEQNPMAEDDLLGKAIEKAKELNIELYAYYNAFLDDIYADKHSEHRMIDKDGKPVISYDYYKGLCPNSPYTGTVREKLAELVFNYDIDGIFLDISYYTGETCFCDFCTDEFYQIYGYALSGDIKPGSVEYADFREFKRTSRARFLTTIAEDIREIKTIPIIWNGSGSIYLAEPETDWFSDYYTTEFHAPDYLDGILRAKWMQSREKDFIMSTPSELGSWGDWTMVPEITLKSVVCSIAAHGGGVYYNHTPYPSGEFAKNHIPPLTENIKAAFKYLEGFESRLRGAVSSADTALLFSIETKRFHENGYGPDDYSYFSSLKGAAKMLLASGFPFDIIDESSLNECEKYKTIIVPGAYYACSETIGQFAKYIDNGGQLIITDCFAMYDEYGKMKSSMPDFTGVKYVGESDFSVEYIVDINNNISSGLPDMPLLVKKSGKLMNYSRTEGTKELAKKAVPPFEATISRHVYHQHAHPYERTEASCISLKETGKGKVLHISSDIFRSYMDTSNPWLMKLFNNCLSYMNSNPFIKIDAPECVYATIMENQDGYLVQLMNVNGPLFEAGKIFPTTMLPVPAIEIITGIDCSNAEIIAGDSNTILDKTTNGFIIKNAGVHTAVQLKR